MTAGHTTVPWLEPHAWRVTDIPCSGLDERPTYGQGLGGGLSTFGADEHSITRSLSAPPSARPSVELPPARASSLNVSRPPTPTAAAPPRPSWEAPQSPQQAPKPPSAPPSLPPSRPPSVTPSSGHGDGTSSDEDIGPAVPGGGVKPRFVVAIRTPTAAPPPAPPKPLPRLPGLDGPSVAYEGHRAGEEHASRAPLSLRQPGAAQPRLAKPVDPFAFDSGSNPFD